MTDIYPYIQLRSAWVLQFMGSAVHGFRSSYAPRLRRITSNNAIAHCTIPQRHVTNFTFASSTVRPFGRWDAPLPSASDWKRTKTSVRHYCPPLCIFTYLKTVSNCFFVPRNLLLMYFRISYSCFNAIFVLNSPRQSLFYHIATAIGVRCHCSDLPLVRRG